MSLKILCFYGLTAMSATVIPKHIQTKTDGIFYVTLANIGFTTFYATKTNCLNNILGSVKTSERRVLNVIF